MRESRSSGSVEGVMSNHDPYSDSGAHSRRMVRGVYAPRAGPQTTWIRGNLRQRFVNCCRECLQPGFQIGSEMHPQCSTTPFSEHLEVSACLSGFHDTERIFLAGNREVVRVVAGDLQKDSAVRAALISLPRRIQKPRTEPKASRDMLVVAYA